MSKNISINEGDLSRNFTPQKLKTAQQGSGSVLWVPKDERKRKTISIRKPGVYQAWVDDVYAYSKATVSGLMKESDVTLTDKNVTENGTYKAEDENFYGYKTITVNVPGGGDNAPPSTAPGSSVYGVDPDGDGKETVTISVDDEGNLIRTKLAEYIEIDTMPDKLEYRDGERILLSGAVVRGYLANGTPYKNASYADSILPLYQGDNPPDEEEYSDKWLPGGVVLHSPLYAEYSGGGEYPDYDPAPTYVLDVGSGLAAFDKAIAETPRGFSAGSNAILEQIRSIIGQYESIHPVTVVASTRDGSFGGWSPLEVYIFTSLVKGSTITGSTAGALQIETYTTLVYGDQPFNITQFRQNPNSSYSVFEGIDDGDNDYRVSSLNAENASKSKQTITLTWPREGDRKHLKTTYEITVTE